MTEPHIDGQKRNEAKHSGGSVPPFKTLEAFTYI